MIDNKPKYITKDDYFEWAGIDLELEFNNGNTDNPSNAVNIFLSKIENWLLSFIKQNYFLTPQDSEWDEDVFKQALLYQIEYWKLHGDLSIKIARDETGAKLPILSPNAQMILNNNFYRIGNEGINYGYRY